MIQDGSSRMPGRKCSRCHRPIPEQDLRTGRALTYAGSDYCSVCARVVSGKSGYDARDIIDKILKEDGEDSVAPYNERTGMPATQTQKQERKSEYKTSLSGIPRTRGAKRDVCSRLHPEALRRSSDKNAVLIVGGVVLGLIVIAGLILYLSLPRESEVLENGIRNDVGKKEDPALERMRKAQEAYAEVTRYIQEHPESLRDIVQKLRQTLPSLRGTPYETNAERDLKRYERLLESREKKEFEQLVQDFKKLMFETRYDQAEEICRDVLTRIHDETRRRQIEEMLAEATLFRKNRDAWNRMPEFYCIFTGSEVLSNVIYETEYCEHTDFQSPDKFYLKFPYRSGSVLRVRFKVDRIPRRAVLRLKHLTSWGGSEENSYSPIDIFFNGEVMERGFNAGIYEKTHSWDVTNRLRLGENHIRIITAGARTHYWLFALGIFFEEE